MWLRIFAIALAAIGTLISLDVVFFKQEDGSINYVSSTIELAGPWLIACVVLVFSRWYRGIAIAGAMMLFLEVACYYSTFVNPTKSSDPLVYVVKPYLQLLFLGIGLPLGWFIDKRLKLLAASREQ